MTNFNPSELKELGYQHWKNSCANNQKARGKMNKLRHVSPQIVFREEIKYGVIKLKINMYLVGINGEVYGQVHAQFLDKLATILALNETWIGKSFWRYTLIFLNLMLMMKLEVKAQYKRVQTIWWAMTKMSPIWCFMIFVIAWRKGTFFVRENIF